MRHPLAQIKKDLQWNMEGLSGVLLSAIMLAVAGVLAWTAIKAPTPAKAIVLAWVVLP